MARRKFEIGKGAAGAVLGAAAGATTAVLLSDKKARKTVLNKLGDLRNEAEKTIDSIAQEYSSPKLALRNTKGGRSKTRGKRLTKSKN